MTCPDEDPSAPQLRRIAVRSVWAHNLDYEFNLIRSVIDLYPLISMDTEFPGVVMRVSHDDPGHRNPSTNYLSLRHNVNLLNLIQFGLTISDYKGNLPDFGTETGFIWEFNFKDFDVTRDAHATDSVELLRRQGIDFDLNREIGIDSMRFAELMMSSGLVLNEWVCWVTFHSAYDFGYLVKCLTQRKLTDELSDFLQTIEIFFGHRVYDVKHLIRFCANLYGGLDRVCKVLGVERAIGRENDQH